VKVFAVGVDVPSLIVKTPSRLFFTIVLIAIVYSSKQKPPLKAVWYLC